MHFPSSSKSVLALVCFGIALGAEAADLPARNCEIYIKTVRPAPSSHGSASIEVDVKVRWLGAGEYVRRVAFYGSKEAHDLGNLAECRMDGRSGAGPFEIRDGAPGDALGESRFRFSVASGSVTSACPGFHYTTRGAFFVETNLNTYWLNPRFDSNELFYFDSNGYRQLTGRMGWYQGVPTDRADMAYYNPAGCR